MGTGMIESTSAGRGLSRWTRRSQRGRTLGPLIDGDGRLQLGDDVRFGTGPVRSRITVAADAGCVIGSRVFVGYGASISCVDRLTIGDDTVIGPFAMIYDSDFHVPGQHDLRLEHAVDRPVASAPVEIGCDVVIGDCVTILRGATIGDRCVIDSGAVVWSPVPADTRVRASGERERV